MFAKNIKFQLFTRGPLMLVYNHNGTVSDAYIHKGALVYGDFGFGLESQKRETFHESDGGGGGG